MNYAALSFDELSSLALTDEGARSYIADNAADFVDQVIGEGEDLYDPAGCYEDGYSEGSNAQLKALREKFLEDAQIHKHTLRHQDVTDSALYAFLTELVDALEP